ncbi:MAG: hypothetical protein AB7E51_18950 [Pseudodesulfovibrio sp.]|uniref:hypothetical protein n=1 Tax=Pseudodesulfovibrio sp. TaxID=2035812 RepID=UPI003D1229AC
MQEVRDGLSRIVDADHASYQAWLEAGGQPEVVAYVAPEPPTLASVKAGKIAEITAGCDATLSPLAAEYGVMERATWDQQALEAAALQADPAAAAPLVRGMAAERGIDAVELAGRILGHEARWKAIAGSVIGQRQALWDRVDAITDDTPDAVDAVQAIEVAYSLES